MNYKPILALFLSATVSVLAAHDAGSAKCSEPIPWSEIGRRAGAEHHGNGLSVVPSGNGAVLRCVFQKLEGEATTEGLWLTSFAEQANDRFRVVAVAVGRAAMLTPLDSHGEVKVKGGIVRYFRPGLVEEYSVSMDGVRQDFIVESPPLNSLPGELRVELAVDGARVEQTAYGARLALEGSGRKIAYSRLRVVDATGRELLARMEVQSAGDEVTSLKSIWNTSDLWQQARLLTSSPAICASRLALLVNDTDAVYPVRIDPTFSDEDWTSLGNMPGTDGTVFATVADGAGNLYVGGQFTAAGDVVATNIARWNGSSWSPLGSGLNGRVRALALSGSELYAGGLFTDAGGVAASRIAKWDGTNWSALGSGITSANSEVFSLLAAGTDLYVGGIFTNAGGIDANYIAKWDGNSWSPLGHGLNGQALAMAMVGSDLYAGGQFFRAGGDLAIAIGIARWNGSSWSAVGPGPNPGVGGGAPYVFALAVSETNLYVGGFFTSVGGSVSGSPANYIARWNGSSWSTLGSGTSNRVMSLAVSGTNLYAGTSDGSPANQVVRWNGSSWSAVGTFGFGSIRTLAVSGGDLYAGGDFNGTIVTPANNIARWNGTNWSSLNSGSGPHFRVNAIAVSDSNLYVGGEFKIAGGKIVNHIASWDGNSWSALGLGMDQTVLALALSGTNLYAGGFFSWVTNNPGGGVTVNSIAKWDGSSWSALGSGMNQRVNALAVSGGEIYAGGPFTMAGGNPAFRIAKWNGSTWSAVGAGLNSAVFSLAASGTDVYAGGLFTVATNNPGGGFQVNYIAKWDGSIWSALGTGMNLYVEALAIANGDVFAGGDFTMAGGNAANYIARWSANSWTALGSGMNSGGAVYALAVSGGNLFAGGSFTNAGGIPAQRIAVWDGADWSAIGSGMNGTVFALAASDHDLFAGGAFSIAGGKVSSYVARANVGVSPPLVFTIVRSGSDITLSWPAEFPTAILESSPALGDAADWGEVPSSGNSAIVMIGPDYRFFRLKIP